MAWGARMVMPTDRAVLMLAQWFSPAYPVGGFSFSHGLEQAVLAGEIKNYTALEVWLKTLLVYGAGRNDVILLAAAYHAKTDAEVGEIDALAQALAPAEERLAETVSQGEAFARITAAVQGRDMAARCYPVAVGCATRMADLPLGLSAQMYLQAMTGNLVSAGIRLGCCGQTEGQKMLHRLSDQCQTVANSAIMQTIEDLGSGCVALDIAAMNHETLYSRIFRS